LVSRKHPCSDNDDNDDDGGGNDDDNSMSDKWYSDTVQDEITGFCVPVTAEDVCAINVPCIASLTIFSVIIVKLSSF